MIEGAVAIAREYHGINVGRAMPEQPPKHLGSQPAQVARKQQDPTVFGGIQGTAKSSQRAAVRLRVSKTRYVAQGCRQRVRPAKQNDLRHDTLGHTHDVLQKGWGARVRQQGLGAAHTPALAADEHTGNDFIGWAHGYSAVAAAEP